MSNNQQPNDIIRVQVPLVVEVTRADWELNYGRNESTRQITEYVRATVVTVVERDPAVVSWGAKVTVKR